MNKANMIDRTWPGITTSALSFYNIQDGNDKTATEIKQYNKLRTINNITRIGTWNVGNLQPCGQIEELERELDTYRWHVLGLA